MKKPNRSPDVCVCFHACTYLHGDATACCGNVRARMFGKARKVSNIGSMHLKQEVGVSLRLGDKVRHRHLHSQDGYLFHRVTMSQSAHQPCIFFIDFGPHCKPHVRFNPKRAIMTMFPLKHEPQPPCAHRTPIKSRADSKLLAGFLFLDFTSWIYINFMIYPSYKMKCHTFFFFSLAIVGLLQSSSMAADIIIFGGMYFHKVYFVVLL